MGKSHGLVMLCSIGVVAVALGPALATGAAATPPLTVPSWVEPGLQVEYTEDLGGYVNYNYIDTVTARTPATVRISTYRWSPGLVGTGQTLTWSCSAACTGTPAATSAQFWVDPANPAASLRHAPFAYEYMGPVNFRFHNVIRKAYLFYYPSAHGPVVSYFQASTGRFLYHKEYAYSYTYHVWYTIQLSFVKIHKP